MLGNIIGININNKDTCCYFALVSKTFILLVWNIDFLLSFDMEWLG